MDKTVKIPEIFASNGEDAFRALEREVTAEIGKLSGKIILTGGGVVKDRRNYAPLHQNGDIFFIEAGTLHAICKGILLAEVEQNTNLAYRISDYGRLGADGKPRPLHISKALDVINRKRMQRNDLEPDITIYPFGIVKTLSQCEYFTVEHLTLKGKAGLMEEKSFLSAVLLDGEAVLSYLGGSMRLKKGDSIFVPAKCRITLMGEADIICTHI